MLRTLRTFSVIAVIAATAAITGGATANASTTDLCGYFTATNGRAYYYHCGDTTVKIKLTVRFAPDPTICVKPGVTDIGSKSSVTFAGYVGGAGCSPAV